MLVDRLVGWRLSLLLFAAVAAAVALPLSRQLRLDRSIENLFAPDDPLMQPYRLLQEQFGAHDVVLAVYVDRLLLDERGIGILQQMEVRKRLEAVPGVRETLSLVDVDRALRQLSPPPLSTVFRRRSPRPGTSIANSDNQLAVRFLDIFGGILLGADRQTAGVLCVLESTDRTDVPREETIRGLRAVVEGLPEQMAPAMIAGAPVLVVEGFDLIEQDGHLLGRVTTALLGVTILLCFRSLRWALIPVAVVAWAVVVTRGLLALMGFQLSIVSSMLAAIVTITGVATVVHVALRYRSERESGLAPRDAMANTAKGLARPIFFTCVTDAVGFASLSIASVEPVRDFGQMMAVASLMVLAAVAVLVPGLALLGSLDRDPHHAWGERRIRHLLAWLVGRTERHRKALSAVLMALMIVAVTGVLRSQVETNFTRNFRADHPIVSSYDFIETRLGGAGLWDVLIPAPETLDEAYCTKIRNFQSKLTSSIPRPPSPVSSLTKVVSLVDAIDAAEASHTLSLVPIPVREEKLLEELPEFVRALRSQTTNDQQGHLRIMLRANEQLPAERKIALIESVRTAARQAFPADGDAQAAEVTGPFVLMANLIGSLIRDQWRCFAVAILGIGLCMVLAFGDLRLALVGLVPNVLPILLVLGGLGWLDIKINMGAAMIAAAAMGLSVDSSIHYVTAFRRSRDIGADVPSAIHAAQAEVGPAILFSTLALVVGFAALCTSQFVPTIYFGILGSLSLLGALLGNVIVLPLLLRQAVRQ